jgi:hypothetical protein
MFPPLSGIRMASRARRVSGTEAEAVWRQVFSAVRERSVRSAPPYQNIQPQDLVIEIVGDSAAVVTFHLGVDKRVSRRTLVWKNTSDGWEDRAFTCIRSRCGAITSTGDFRHAYVLRLESFSPASPRAPYARALLHCQTRWAVEGCAPTSKPAQQTKCAK